MDGSYQFRYDLVSKRGRIGKGAVMKVFVAGAGGAIGRRLVPLLVDAGHEVTGMTRSADRAARLTELGARPAVADALDPDAVLRTVRQALPDVVINELTDLPQALNPRKLARYYAANDRVRREGTANLLRAAEDVGAGRMVVQSTAFWYRPRPGGGLHRERDPLFTDAPEPIGAAVRTMAEVEASVLGHPGIDGVVLRYGFFYGPGTWYTADGDVGRQVGKRRYPIIGSGSGVFSFVHVDDAAAATVAALEAPPGVYNVVDDDPAAMTDWLPELATALGAKRPMRVPRLVASLAAGRGPVEWTESVRGASNAKARVQLGWTPRWESWRSGFREAL
jgi:nucleoside-diphosphate-sugar epimerase